MAMRGKNINLFLMDGEPGGRVKCTIGNWTGIVYKIPRSDINKCKDIDALKQSGVYFLFGSDENDNGIVYIGQAGARKNGKGLLLRVEEPHSSIDYWTEAIMLTTSNNTFGPTEISYLENRFFNLATEAGRYIVKNGNDPNPGNLTEEKESELEDFIDYSKIVIGVLGHKIFDSLAKTEDKKNVLTMKWSSGNATGCLVGDGFVIFKGSLLNPNISSKCPPEVINSRKRYAKSIDEDYVTTKDLLFTSPSAAAKFIAGTSVSGNAVWKDSNGTELKAILNGKIKKYL